MPVFYLHLHNSVGFVRDEEGRSFPDLAAARAEAIKSIRSLLAEDLRAGRLDLRGRLDIAGADGEILESVAFGQAVEVVREGGGA
jgi:hypothetical protein